MYDVVPYYMAKITADIPSFILVPFIFNAITYFMVGYNDNIEQYFMFALTLVLNTFGAISFGYLISSAIADGATALMLAPVLVFPLILTSGFFSNAEEMPIYIEVFSMISPIMYANHNLVMI